MKRLYLSIMILLTVLIAVRTVAHVELDEILPDLVICGPQFPGVPIEIKTVKNWRELVSGLGYLSNDEELKLRVEISIAKPEEKIFIHKAILTKLNSEEDSAALRQCMVYLCMFGRNKETADAFVNIMNSNKERADRKLAASFLEQVGSEENLDALLRAIKEDKGQIPHGRDIASNAYSSIGSIGGEKAAKILLLLWNSNEYVPDHSLFSMGMTGSPQVLELILDVLEQKEHRLRHNAAAGLAAFASRNRDNTEMSEQVLTLLRKYVRDDDPEIRRRVLDGFAAIGQPEDIPLMNSLTSDPYSEIVSYLENGVLKKKTVYPVQERAEWAIIQINNNRFRALFGNWNRDDDKFKIRLHISSLWNEINMDHPKSVRSFGPSEVFSDETIDVYKWMAQQREYQQQFKTKRLDLSQIIAVRIQGDKAVALSEIRDNVMVYALSKNDEKWVLNRMQFYAIGVFFNLEQFMTLCFDTLHAEDV